MHGLPNLSLIKTALLLLGLGVPALSQQLWIESVSDSVPGLGDTVVVDVYVDTQGRGLTSIGLALSYDPRRLEAIGSSNGGRSEPFSPQAALGGGIYTNDVLSASVEDARARFVLVTSQQSGSRQVILGRHLLARISLQVIGAATTTRVGLVTGGPDGPVFTEVGVPGREHRFHLVESDLFLRLSAEGYVAVDDVTIDSRQPLYQSLSGIHPSPNLTWQIAHDGQDLLQADLIDGVLRVVARPRVSGTARLQYSASDTKREVLSGEFEVTVVPATPLLVLGPVSFDEDAMYLLPDPVDASAPVGHMLQIDVGAGLVAESGAEGWQIMGESNWSGVSFLTMHLHDADSMLIDSLLVPVFIHPVDDAPRLVTPPDPIVAMLNVDSWGPAISELLIDVDDDLAAMEVSVTGDSVIGASVETGRLRLRGLAQGEGAIRLQVIDHNTGAWSWSLSVSVHALTQAPDFRRWDVPTVVVSEAVVWRWGDILADGDALDDLQMDVESSTHLSAWAGSDGLHVEAQSAGTAWVRILVTDLQGNTSSVVLQIDVVEIADVVEMEGKIRSEESSPVAGDLSPSVDEVPEQVGGSTGDDVSQPVDDMTPDDIAVDSPLLTVNIDLPEQVQLTAGMTMNLDLAAALSGVDAAQVLWGTSDGTLVRTHVDASGRLTLDAPLTASGHDEVSIHVYVDQQRLTKSMTVILVAPPARLQILEIPTIHLTQGTSHILGLSEYVDQAEGPVRWQAVSGQLVTATIHDSLLTLYAEFGRVGEEALRLIVSDGEQEAQRLLRVIVEEDEETPLQINAPPQITMEPGERLEIDASSWIVSGIVDEWALTAPPDGGRGWFEGAVLVLQIDERATSGILAFDLEAISGSHRIGLTLQAAVVDPPALQLAVPSIRHLTAGQQQPLVELDELVIESDGPVEWQILGNHRLGVVIDEGGWLIVDARNALPGRQVLRLQATTAARSELVEVVVRIETPTIQATQWHVELTAGVGARLSLDGLADSSFASLSWAIVTVGDGIHAVWEETVQGLHVVADEAGIVSLEARLPSGILVAASELQILLRDEPAPPPTLDAQASSRETASALWALSQPAFESPWEGGAMSIELARFIDLSALHERSGTDSSVVSGQSRLDQQALDIARALMWEVRLLSGEGAVILEGDSLFVEVGSSTQAIWLRAVDESGRMQSVVLPVHAKQIPIPSLEYAVVDAGLDVIVTAHPPAVVHLEVDGARIQLAEDGSGQVRMSPGIHRLPLVLIVQVEGIQKIVQQQVTVIISGEDGGRFSLSDGSASVEIPAGSQGAVVIQPDPQGVRLMLSSHIADYGVGLFLASDSQLEGASSTSPRVASGSTSIQWLSPHGWEAVPAWRVTLASGVYARVFRDGLYRIGETETFSTEIPLVHTYPNPFNAHTTLQFFTTSMASGVVELTIYNMVGQRVRHWSVQHQGGVGSVIWDGYDAFGRSVGSGTYLVGVLTATDHYVHKLTLIQ